MDAETVAAGLRRKHASRFELWKAIRKARLRERRQLLLAPPGASPKPPQTAQSPGVREKQTLAVKTPLKA